MSSKSKSTTTNTSTPNTATTALFNPIFDQAKGLINTPFTPYSGQLAPGLTQPQSQAIGLAQSSVGTGQNAVQQGLSAAQGVAGYTPNQVTPGMLSGANLSAYMDPYTQNVIDTTNQNIDQQRQRSINGQDGQFTRAGAWGGSRQGVADALTNQAYGQIAAQTDAGLNSQNFTQAQTAATADLNRNLTGQQSNQSAGLSGQNLNLSAGGMLGNLGSLSNSMNVNDINQLGQLGGVAQQTQAAQDAAKYSEFLRGQQHPLQQAGMLQSLLGSIPAMYAGATTTGNTQSSSLNPLGWFQALAKAGAALSAG